MRKHADASDADPHGRRASTATILDLADQTWQECLQLGEANGYRNAQASLLAPTGTIGLMMDCDTTGIEPDLALVKFKKLVGGGSMQIVNQTVPRALKNLGYQPEQIEAITEYIAEHGHVVDAPGLQARALRGVRLRDGRARDQPDGPRPDDGRRAADAVRRRSRKTVNMPESATVEDIEKIYFEGWKLGLKALAIYRDNCKVGQPLSDAEEEGRPEPRPRPTQAVRAARAPPGPQAPAQAAPRHRDQVLRGRR